MNPFQTIIRIHRGISSRLRCLGYRMLGVRISGGVWLRAISIPRQWNDITLETGVALDDGVTLVCSGPPRTGKILIKTGTYVNRNTILDAHERVEIGRDCLIGPGCFITDSNHGTDPGSHPGAQECSVRPTVIEDGVWLGANVVVLSGVRIGTGAVVGAGAVVTREVEAYDVVVGVPAKTIGSRLGTRSSNAAQPNSDA